MPRGRPTRLSVTLTPAERRTTMPHAQARRGRIIVLVADGLPISRVAQRVGISRRFVYKWVARFKAQGVLGLYDRPRQRPERRTL